MIRFKNAHVIPWSYKDFLTNKQASSKEQKDPAPLNQKPLTAESMVMSDEPMGDAIMPLPRLKKDEYMMHVHALFTDDNWYHLNVIVTEDENGNLKFRRFFLYRIPRYNHTLPPGVVC